MPLTLTRKQINEFVHHLHIIPISRGYMGTWLKENAPGWDSNSLLDALKRQRAIEEGGTNHSGWVATVDKVTIEVPGLQGVTDVVKGTVHVKD